MDRKKVFIWGVLLLMVAVCGGQTSQAVQERPSKDIVSENESFTPERATIQSLPCNWSGSIRIFPEVKCNFNRCAEYRRTLTFTCSGGFITEVSAERVCSRCFEF